MPLMYWQLFSLANNYNKRTFNNGQFKKKFTSTINVTDIQVRMLLPISKQEPSWY